MYSEMALIYLIVWWFLSYFALQVYVENLHFNINCSPQSLILYQSLVDLALLFAQLLSAMIQNIDQSIN